MSRAPSTWQGGRGGTGRDDSVGAAQLRCGVDKGRTAIAWLWRSLDPVRRNRTTARRNRHHMRAHLAGLPGDLEAEVPPGLAPRPHAAVVGQHKAVHAAARDLALLECLRGRGVLRFSARTKRVHRPMTVHACVLACSASACMGRRASDRPQALQQGPRAPRPGRTCRTRSWGTQGWGVRMSRDGSCGRQRAAQRRGQDRSGWSAAAGSHTPTIGSPLQQPPDRHQQPDHQQQPDQWRPDYAVAPTCRPHWLYSLPPHAYTWPWSDSARQCQPPIAAWGRRGRGAGERSERLRCLRGAWARVGKPCRGAYKQCVVPAWSPTSA